MKKLYALNIRGKYKEWNFPILADPRHVENWREDGLLVHEIVNTYPDWIVTLGLTKIWGKLQDWGFIPL